MRTPYRHLTFAITLSLFAACTLKDVDPPALAGPSTLAYSIVLTANTDTLIQDGVSSATIDIIARDPAGQLINGRQLRAEIMVGGVVQDYGTLSTKTPVTGQAIRYTAPAASPLAAGQVAQTVTIAVTPTDSGNFANEISRQVEIRLVPQGVILPTNPTLAAAFTVTPLAPQAFSTASFDASTTTNGGTACLNACSYAWNFGDGTTGAGLITTHQYRTVGIAQASLTVTDTRGAQTTAVRSITVGAATPPANVAITVSPSGGATVNQDLFFTATASPAPGRTIARYDWNFGDGQTSSGSTTSHKYLSTGTYQVSLVVTDDVGSVGRPATTTAITVGSGTPAGSLSFLPVGPRVGSPVTFNAGAITPAIGATIASYRWSYGDGSPEETGSQALQIHAYAATGNFVATVTVTDSFGRTATSSVSVPITP